MLHQSWRLIVGILYQEEVYRLWIPMHYGLLVIILYIVLVFKLVHEPFYVPKNLFFGPKMIFLGDYGKKWRRLIMLKINFFVCHMTFNWPSRAFKLVHQPFYVPKQPFLGQKWHFEAITTKGLCLTFNFTKYSWGSQITWSRNQIVQISKTAF